MCRDGDGAPDRRRRLGGLIFRVAARYPGDGRLDQTGRGRRHVNGRAATNGVDGMARKAWHFAVVGGLGVLTAVLTIGAATTTARIDRERLMNSSGAAISGFAPTSLKIDTKLQENAISAPADAQLDGVLGRGAKNAPPALRPAFEALIAGNHEEARYIAQPFAQSGVPAAQHLLGFLFEKGLSVEQDAEKAKVLYFMAAEGGDLDARVALGNFAADAGDHEEAVRQFTLAAEAGDARAMTRLGVHYTRGAGVKADTQRGAAYFEQAAALNEGDALYHLGFAHLIGRGVAKDAVKSRSYFTRAANQGHPLASYNLAVLIDAQSANDSEKSAAVTLMRRAADGGYAPALTAMGLFAHRGLTDDRAADWFEKAAAAGDRQGRFLYAVALAKGDGRAMDKNAARQLAETLLNDPSIDSALRQNVRTLINEIGDRQSLLQLRE